MKETLFKTILNCLSLSLFKINKKNIDTIDIPFILSEAKAQTIFPLVYAALCGEYDLSQYQTPYFSIISQNVKVTEEHKTLHKLLSANDIGYVFIKGCASALFYPDPLLRTMGDVDLLVRECDIEKTAALLLANGFYTDDTDDEKAGHISFHHSKTNIHVELHRRIIGIPDNAKGEKLKLLFADIFEKAVLENNEYYRPCDFHHGLVILLHTAHHLTHTGVGLRHLCDWAVFVEKFTDSEFETLFKADLKATGLWQFAKILTRFAVKYLGCPEKEWCGKAEPQILESLLNDIFNGGNFGKKDNSRHQHLKYITDRSNTNRIKSPLNQLFTNIILKAKNEIGFVKKVPLLLPFGIICIAFKYLWLVLTGKRKMDNKTLINAAFDRKELYDTFELFK